VRNKRILVIAANPQDGTSFYRAWGPLSELGCDLVYATDLSWSTLSTIDIVFIQRPSHQVHVDMVVDAQKFNVPVWCDWDDDGFNLEESNPAFEYFNRDEQKAVLREVLRLSDVCTVSTPHLREIFQKEVDREIIVLPNATDERWFSVEPYKIFPFE
jgi:hypothetical protein